MTWAVLGAVVAGWIDAVIGGGGLVLIPLLMATGMAPTTALATNKFAACLGTSSATWVLARKYGLPPTSWKYVPVALICSGCGALAASLLATAFMRPLVIVLLLASGCFVALRPRFGVADTKVRQRPVMALVSAAAIAFYDGIFGPGTGMFLIMVFTALLTGNFLRAAVLAKVVNVSTNIGALVVFAIAGHVWWQWGIVLAIANIAGAQLGARTVIGGGTKLVRAALLIMVLVMSMRLVLMA